MKIILNLFLALLAGKCLAQTGSINGYIKDKQLTPVSFANILLHNSSDSSIQKGNLSDENGYFNFEKISPGNYYLAISQIGLKKYFSNTFSISNETEVKDLGTISMEPEISTLNTVVISSQIPLFERKPDKTIVNVSSDLTAGNSTALDILSKSPSVIVDKDGNISLRGKSGVMVMIDGRPTNLSAEQLSNMLNSLPAEQINQIELITNPSSKYDAEGTAGIVNIKLKKSKLYGTNGNLAIGYGQGFYDRENGNVSLNHRSENVNVFGSYSAYSRTNSEKILIERRFKQNGVIENIFDQNSRIKSEKKGHMVKSGVDISLNKNNFLGMVFNGRYDPKKHYGGNYTNIYDSNKNLISAANTDNINKSLFGSYSLNLNYESKLDTLGTKINMDADHSLFTSENDGNFIISNFDSLSTFINTNSITNNTKSKIYINSFKADLIKPLGGKWKMESGLKFSSVDTDNDVKQFNLKNGDEVLDTTTSNHFNYEEVIYAGYGIFSKEWNKFSFQGGIRGEQTFTKGFQLVNDSSFTQAYFQFFPTASASYTRNDNHEWGISYSRRIDRPDYQDMNPFRMLLDQYTYEQGNPFLKPQFSNNYELSYTFKKAYSASFSYSRTNNIMMEVTRQNDSTHVTFINKENLDINEHYALTLSLPISVAKRFTSNNSITAFYLFFNSIYDETIIKQGSTSFSFNSFNQLILKKNFSVQADFNYNAPLVYGLFHIKSQYGLSISLQKKVLNERGKINLTAKNIIRNKYMTADVDFQNMDFTFKQMRDNQYLNISFSYKFGKNTISPSRKRNSGSDEEKNRVKRDK